MKHFLKLPLSLLLFIASQFGCNGDEANSANSANDSYEARKHYLTMCHLIEDHSTDLESLKGMVTDFLAAQKPVTKGSSVVLPQITEVKDVTCVPETGFKEKSGLNKNTQKSFEETTEIPFYEFTLEKY